MTDRIVVVEWEDAGTDHGWSKEGLQGLADLMPGIISAGIVVAEDERGITIAAGVNTHPEATHKYLCPLTIPHSAIRKVTELGPKRRKADAAD